QSQQVELVRALTRATAALDAELVELPSLQQLQTIAAAQTIDGLVSSRAEQPRACLGRNAIARPLLHRHREGFLQRLFCQIEVAAKRPNQPRKQRGRFGAIDLVDGVRFQKTRSSGQASA